MAGHFSERSCTYIVVGGGTAGCVIAARLTELANVDVLLLEAGGRPIDPTLNIPLGLMAMNYRRHSWQYEVEPDESRNGVREVWPAGRTLGGTSAINGMLWGRGARRDYDSWAAEGLGNWGYDAVQRHFEASEAVQGGRAGRGVGGPVRVVSSTCEEPLAGEFLESALVAGHTSNSDYNSGVSVGVAPLQIARSKRMRQSTYRAYLAGRYRRKNLRVENHAHVSRVVIRGGRAVGVEYVQNGRLRQAFCSGEVILCAGALGSPALLLRSGVGPADHLAEHSIGIAVDAPGVGANLRNHPVMALVFEVTEPTLNNQRSFPHLVGELVRFAVRGGGLLTTAPSHVIVYGGLEGEHLDYSITFGAYGVTSSGSGVGGRFIQPMQANAITLRVQLFGSDSRGTVRLRSSNLKDKPLIRYRALGSTGDIVRMTGACRQARAIVQSRPFSNYVVDELTPGSGVRSDRDWESALRRLISAGRHYGGTCAMGQGDLAVVDEYLRVRGVANLRVVDASVMPDLPSSGLFAPTVMIAERAAEVIAAVQKPLASAVVRSAESSATLGEAGE